MIISRRVTGVLTIILGAWQANAFAKDDLVFAGGTTQEAKNKLSKKVIQHKNEEGSGQVNVSSDDTNYRKPGELSHSNVDHTVTVGNSENNEIDVFVRNELLFTDEDLNAELVSDTFINNPNDVDFLSIADFNWSDGITSVGITIVENTNNQPPRATPITVSTTEDSANFSVDLLQSATDFDGNTLSVVKLELVFGDDRGVEWVDNKLNINPQAYDDLATSINQYIIYDYNISDGKGGVISNSITLVIKGVDDTPLNVPIYHSNPGSSNIIYLDFDGALVSGGFWNYFFTDGEDIHAEAITLDNDPDTFTAAELDLIYEIFLRVSEDFSPFDVNVTTDVYTFVNAEYSNQATSVITPTNWYGSVGVAVQDSFGADHPLFQPSWVFNSHPNIFGEAYRIANVVTHELGHNFALEHHGQYDEEYYLGHGGTGETSWAPIMGRGHDTNLRQWSKGEYTGANNQQDDLAILASRLGYREDDHGNDFNSATVIAMNNGKVAEGIIEKNTDFDFFEFNVGGGSKFIFHLNPFDVNPNDADPDDGAKLDILAQLYDESGVLLQSSNPIGKLNATINYTNTSDVAKTMYVR